ncbi:creatininase family protein, partial [Planctomycetota bacterium]
MLTKKFKFALVALVILTTAAATPAQQKPTPLILQEMSWLDVENYLKTSDMVIIPLGSTEQHGKHLPLGTDCYEALGMSKIISEKTGVLVAPVLWVGYSVYHSGFPGTLSLKPETMEQVLFETAEMLIGYGFKRIMFFNYHGGNGIVQDKVIHRINHNTTATAIAIGHGSPIQTGESGDLLDMHAGKSETSIMLHLRPDLVRMDR